MPPKPRQISLGPDPFDFLPPEPEKRQEKLATSSSHSQQQNAVHALTVRGNIRTLKAESKSARLTRTDTKADATPASTPQIGVDRSDAEKKLRDQNLDLSNSNSQLARRLQQSEEREELAAKRLRDALQEVNRLLLAGQQQKRESQVRFSGINDVGSL